MVFAKGRHRDSFHGGNEVIQVSQRSSKARQLQGTTRSGGGTSKTNNNNNSITSSSTTTTAPTRARGEETKRVSIAGRMWDSFESESASEDDDNRHKEDRTKPVVARAKEATTTLAASIDDDQNSINSRSSRTDSNSRNNSEPSFAKGDSISVRLSSGKKAKGTISGERSRGRYDVTLDNGDVEKRIGADALSLQRTRCNERHKHPSSDRSIQSQKSVRTGRRESRDRSASDHTRESDDRDDRDTRRRRRSPPAPLAGSPPSKQATGIRAAGGITASPSSSKASFPDSTSGSGEPDQQLSSVAHSSRQGVTHDAPVSVANASEADSGVGNTSASGVRTERASSSERAGSSPMAGKVRQVRGLLKTMFLKNGEAGSGDEGSARRRPSRGWSIISRSASPSKRFSMGSGHDGNLDSPSAPPLQDDTGENDKAPTTPTKTGTHGVDAAEDEEGQLAGDSRAGVASTRSEDAAHAGGHTRRFSRGLTRGRSKHRDGTGDQSGVSESPASRSPSLAVQLGKSLRGAIMGKALLGVHKPHADRSQAEPGRDGDGSSDEADSTAANQTGGVERGRRDSKREPRGRNGSSSIHGDGLQEEEGGYGGSVSDGLDEGMFSPDSHLAPTPFGDPRNLPDAVHSYIDERARMEREMSASGPTFLPQTANLVAGPGDGALTWGKRRGSLDITKEASSTTQHSEQHQPFTEAMFKAGVSETRHSTKQGILLEGELQKFSPESMRGVRWHKRYFVLYACACELRYYRTHADAAWGRIPLGERGSIPLRLVVKIEQPSDKKYRGCRFDLVVLHKGDGRHPGLHIRPGHESRVTTIKTFKLFAADPQQRLLWVTVIEALMKNHGWGMDADRRRTTRAPGHGSSSTGAGKSPRAPWGGEAAEENFCGNALPLDDNHNSSIDNTSRRDTSQRSGATGAGPHFRQGSVLTFVEEDDHCTNHLDDAAIETSGVSSLQRGVCIPYSPQGRRGSLITAALTPPPAATFGGARRQTSLKADMCL